MPAPSAVDVRRESVVLPTYDPHAPDRNPMFLEKRVYQGSSGRVYPLPFIDRIAEEPRPRAWAAVFIENRFIRVMILPELGGRIHRVQDKTNGYDCVYYQPVIKPALVGLAGPWASGGIEFNWPQHHRPSTWMPADVAIERAADGSATVWLGDHDPMARLKGMHGVRLHPESSRVEIVVRAYNRTGDVQTFLWWANTATRVHEQYQSFFPPDVTHVADHARRAISTFPKCRGRYYGVDYAGRARRGVPAAEAPRLFRPPEGDSAAPRYAPNDLSWYANIPVPTSYMCLGSAGSFSGGYDFKAQAGLVQVNNPHISPGKKQWTWGNHEFGYAWDRNLTDADERGEYGPYVELMVGVYTDNQPDFSFLQPGETKTWTQVLYPYRAIGPVQEANKEAAVSFRIAGGKVRIGIAVTAIHSGAQVRLRRGGRIVGAWRVGLAPGRPFAAEVPAGRGARAEAFAVSVQTRGGRELIAFAPKAPRRGPVPPPAVEPPEPARVKTSDELFLIGLHLEQYRHATRAPVDYWREGLRRDPGDARCHLAMGRWHLRRGTLAEAERHLRASIARLVARNANPYDGEAYYQLGVCLRQRAWLAGASAGAEVEQAYASFYKATWNHAWQPAGFHALAEIDAARGDWSAALDHLERALRGNADNLRARDLQAIVLRKLGRAGDAEAVLRGTLALDPLDWWARHLRGELIACDSQVRLDLALDCARAGQFRDALGILAAEPKRARRVSASPGTEPLIHYYRAWLHHHLGEAVAERRELAAAARAAPDYCFPARLEEIAILSHAIAANPRDARAPFYLGHLLYDRRRHREAIAAWERAVRGEPGNAVAWRNLGIGYFNILRRPAAARRAYRRAAAADPADPRILYESDQLAKRLGESPARRLRALRRRPRLVEARDDLTVELCALLNQTGAPDKALRIIEHRKFQPWEGGEGQALGQHVRAHLALGRRVLQGGDPAAAAEHFRAAMAAPANLGEAKHLLVNQSDLHYWLGRALAAQGNLDEARREWRAAAEFKGDFQSMRVRAFSEMTYYSALAADRLGRKAAARRLLQGLLAYARRLAKAPAEIDYFATSLPTMLLFDDDLRERQRMTAGVLEAQACLGLGKVAAARRRLRQVLRRDPSHALAADLLADAN